MLFRCYSSVPEWNESGKESGHWEEKQDQPSVFIRLLWEDAKANLLSEWNCFWTCRGMSQGDWQERKYLLISSAAFKLTLFCSFIWSVYVRFVVPTSNVKASCLLFLILYIHSLQKHFRVKCFGKTLKNMIGLNQTFNSNLPFSTRRFGFTCLFLKSENVFPILN